MKMVSARRFRGMALVAGAAVSLGSLGACLNNVQDNLLEQQQPQVILPNAVTNSTGALGLYTGALGTFRTALNGHNNNQETIWNFEGLMTDEFRSGDTFTQRNDADQRQTQENDVVTAPTYAYVQQARGFSRSAITALKQYSPVSATQIGEMYMQLGFMEMTLAQAFCANIPLGETVGGVPNFATPITTDNGVFNHALQMFDSGTVNITANDAAAIEIKNALLIAKARALVDTGNYVAAAALVGSIPANYQYLITYSIPTQDNEWWQMAINTKRYTVGDSVNVPGDNSAANRVANAIPFASMNDPRVSVTNTGGNSFDNFSPWFRFNNSQRDDPVPLVSYIDAQLIIAEAQLNGNTNTPNGGNAVSWGQMTATLNALRAAPPKIGIYQPAVMAALVAPVDASSARALFFREKALWQFSRGERMEDLRRLMRQYGQTDAQTWPNGNYPKGGLFGTRVNFPVPANAGNGSETANPNYDPTKCIGTKP